MNRRTFFALGLSACCAFALTSGPMQPEYVGFKSAGQKDMVDLRTGDFGYSIPVMELPGPSFNYPLTLGYHSGVLLEQEASWVGLGWSLNPGAITRGLNRYPDDYYRGFIQSSIFGENNNETHRIGGGPAYFQWNSAGDISGGSNLGFLSASFSNNSWEGFTVSGGMFGMEYGFNNRTGIGFQETPSFMEALANFISVGAMALDAGGPRGEVNPYTGLDFNANYSGMVSMGMSLVSLGEYAYEYDLSPIGIGSRSISSGMFQSEDFGVVPGIHHGNDSYIEKVEKRMAYGYLNLGAFPRELSEELGSDCSSELISRPAGAAACDASAASWTTKLHRMEFDFAVNEDPKEDKHMFNPVNLPGGFAALSVQFGRKDSWAVSTQDMYSVRAEGAAFGYRPLRQDLGDYYAESGVKAQKISPIKYGLLYLAKWRKPQGHLDKFDRALGDFATRFMEQNEDEIAEQFGAKPIVIFRPAADPSGTFESENWPAKCSENTGFTLPAQCVGFLNELKHLFREHKVHSGSPNYGPFYQAPNVNNFPDRISGSKGIFPKYKNQYNACTNVNFADPTCDPRVPERALIGFTYIRSDGMIYEYHKPAFNWVTKSISVDRPADEYGEKLYERFDWGSLRAENSIERPYAYAWLLSAIKSPDYFDFNSDGRPNQGDIGGWARMEYGHTTEYFHWRNPYQGTSPLPTGKDVPMGGSTSEGTLVTFSSYGSASCGTKQVHHLTGMYSPTHQIHFQLTDRADGLEARLEEVEGSGFSLTGNTLKSAYIRPEPGDVLEIRDASVSAQLQVSSVSYPSPNATLCVGNSEADFQNHACNGTSRDRTVSFTVIGGTMPTTFGRILRMSSTARRSKRVEWIRQYENLNDNGSVEPEEILLREARFEYEHSLAPGIPNSVNFGDFYENGKLTLRKVHIGDGKDFFPPYQFTYEKEWTAAPYRQNHFDRWGYYKSDGGLEPSVMEFEDILDWPGLHSLLKNPSTIFLTDVLKANLGSRLVAIQAAATLTDPMKAEILAAMTLITKNLQFYQQHRTSIGAPGGMGNVSNTLFSRLRNPSIRIGGTGPIFLDNNGTVATGLSAEDRNEIEWFNNSVIDRFFGSAGALKLLVKKNLHRFDHNPNKEDVKAWSLKTIQMPSGGTLEVEYESDDFAYEGRGKVVRVEKLKVDDESQSTFYKSIGMEKSLSVPTGVLEINEELFGRNFEQRAEEIEIRVESVFRLYRTVAAPGGNGAKMPQLNADFALLRQRRWDPKPTASENTLHLVAWYFPPGPGGIVPIEPTGPNFSAVDCGKVPVGSAPGGGTASMVMPIPIDLGALGPEAFQFHANNVVLDDMTDWPEEKHCQRAQVTFKLSKLKAANFQGKGAGTDVCNPADFLGRKFILTWSRKRDIYPGGTDDWGHTVRTANGQHSIPDARSTHWAYPDWGSPGSNPPIRHGYHAWVDFDEFTAERQDQPGAIQDEFQSKYWDFYNFNVYLKSPQNFVGQAAGIPGGGIRTKRVILHTGWAQKPGAQSQMQVMEYAYDGAGGFGGTYSSGSTPVIPPPFNNKGDDRRPKSPATELIDNSPKVSYRTVAAIRPGMGRTVYNFLSSADVDDFWYFDLCNAKPEGCYGSTNYLAARQRWTLNRVGHLQGLPWKMETFDEEGKSVSRTDMKYRVSLDRVMLNYLSEISVINNSDAYEASLALEPTESIVDASGTEHPGSPIHAGSAQFANHPASSKLGKTVSRYRHRFNWHYSIAECTNEVAFCMFNDNNTNQDHPLATLAVTEVEEVEHSVHPLATRSSTDGVATEEAISFFDFLTGSPLVVTKSSLGSNPANRPAKTEVKVPAHWIKEYNPGDGTPSMGAVYQDPNFTAVYTGTQPMSSLKNRNMLDQVFSNSTYSGLEPYTPIAGTEFWRDKLDDRNLYKRNLTTWKRFGSPGTEAWRISGDLAFRMALGSDRKLSGPDGEILMPHPPGNQSVSTYYSNPLYYIQKSRNTQFDSNGKILEIGDAHGNSTAYFYQNGMLPSGQVLNSARKDTRILTMDDFRSVGSLPEGWSGSGLAFNYLARSGEKSLEIFSGGSLRLLLPNLSGGRYELAFWVKRGSAQGTLLINGAQHMLLAPAAGKEWQRIVKTGGMAPGQTFDIRWQAGSGSLIVDDIRIAPEASQVHMTTYDKRGWMTSQSGPNDIITYYNMDSYGRLVEVRDHEGLLLSTQSQKEAEPCLIP